MNSHGQNLVVSGKLKHTLVNVARSDNGALDGETLSDKRHVRDLEVAVGNSQGEDGGSRCHDGDEKVPVGDERGGDEETVDGLGDLELLGALCGDELGGAQLHGLVLLGVGTGEDDNLATHLGGELDGQVTETADTDDTDALGGLGVVKVESLEDGCTTALKRSGSLVGEVVGKLE